MKFALPFAAALSLAAATTWPTEAADPARPNIVFILADDLGYSDLGCYGGEIKTPNLDALAAGGIRYTQFYNTARCWPTRGALLTGFYAQAIRRDQVPGIEAGGKGVRPRWAALLPEMLKPAGYRSYHSGKWHIDGPVLPSGFDRSYNLTDQNRFFDPRQHEEDDKPLPAVERGKGYYATTAIADYAIRHLEDHAANHAGKPFFSYVAFTSPHFPLQAPADVVAEYRELYRQGWDKLRAARFAKQQQLGLVHTSLSAPERELGPPYKFPDIAEKLGAGEVDRPLPWDSLTPEQQEFQAAKMAVHAAMIDVMDREVGRIVAQLKKMDAFDDTLIFFASDNGASAELMVRGDGHDRAASPGSADTYLCLGPGWSTCANTPHRRHKTWVHEGGISTPLIAHWPKGIADRGELRTDVGHVVDFVPTALELAGAAPLKQRGNFGVPALQGRSLVPTLTGNKIEREEGAEGALWWLHEGNRAVRIGDWKLVAAKGKPWELYDLKTDRAESHNLAAAHPEKVRELEAAWQRKMDQFTALAGTDPPPAAQKPGRPKGGKKAPPARKAAISGN